LRSAGFSLIATFEESDNDLSFLPYLFAISIALTLRSEIDKLSSF
jgi:hypothetical protein